MALADHSWFPEERKHIAAVSPEAVFTERGQVSLVADVAAGDQSTAFSLAAIYDEKDGQITGIRTYPLIPSFQDICAAAATVFRCSPEEVQSMFPADPVGNPMLPSGSTTSGTMALASAAAFLTLFQQAVWHHDEEMAQLLRAPDAWRGKLPPFGMRCFGQLIQPAGPAATEAVQD